MGISPERESKNDDDLIESKLKNGDHYHRSPVLYQLNIMFCPMISVNGANWESLIVIT